MARIRNRLKVKGSGTRNNGMTLDEFLTGDR